MTRIDLDRLREALERHDYGVHSPAEIHEHIIKAAHRYLYMVEEAYEVDCRRPFTIFDDDTGTYVHFAADRYLIIHWSANEDTE